MQSPRWLCGTASLSLIALMLSGNSFSFAAPTSHKSASPAKPAKNTKKQQAKLQAKTVAPGTLTTADLNSVSRLKAKISYFSAQDKRRQALESEDEDEIEQREALARRGEKPTVKGGEEGEEDESITSYLEAYMFYLKMRAYPNDKIDTAALYRASQYRKGMPRFNALNDRYKSTAAAAGMHGTNGLPAAGINWEFIGPKNLKTPYQIYYGPATSATSGRVNGLAYHPTNSQIAYLAAGGGGIWKTLDGGLNWANISATFPTQNTGPVLVDPKNPDTVYVGLGDYKGYRGTSGGIIKTVDGGATWTVLEPSNSNLGQTWISAIAIDPDDSTRLVASGGRAGNGLYLTTNSGASWENKQPGDFSTVSISPKRTTATDPTLKNTRFYYASSDFNGIFRSQDKGLTWKKINNVPGASSIGRGTSAIDPIKPVAPPITPTASAYTQVVASAVDANVVYVIDSGAQKIFKGIRNASNDSYAWSDITFGFPGDYNWSQAFYDMHLEAVAQKVGPTTLTDVLYNGLITISSKRGVRDWQDIGITYSPNARTHNDQHSFAAFPGDNRKMLFGNDGGVYGLTYDDVNGTYTIADTLSRTLGITMFYHADFDQTDPSKALGGTQDNATPLLKNNFENWENVGGGDGGGVVIDPTHPSFQYATSQNGGFYWTPNNWTDEFGAQLPLITVGTTNNVNDGPFVATIAIDPLSPSQVYYGGNRFLHRYSNPQLNGGGWETKLGNFDFGSQIIAINVPPSDRPIIFAGTINGKMNLSANDGASWQDITENLPDRSITDIWVNPKNINDVIVTLGGTGSAHVWRSKNALLPFPKWASISGSGTPLPDIPTNAITQDPFDTTGNTFYVGTDIGIFATTDGGATWADASTALGFPNVQVTALKAIQGTGYLMAATYGRGMYRLPLSGFKFETRTSFSTGPNPSLPGQAVLLTAGVSNPGSKAVPPTGTVAFRDGTRSIGSATLNGTGTATLSLSTLTKGVHNLTANYTGDKNNGASTSAIVVQQVGYNTSISLASTPNPSLVREKVTFTSNVTSLTPGGPAATGNVRFLDGTVTLGTKAVDNTGKATLEVTNLAAGNHSITATYAGDTNYITSTSTALTQVVNKNEAAIALTSAPNPAKFGENVRFLAKLARPSQASPVITGTVTFLDGTTEIGTGTVNAAGEAVLNISTLAAGTHPVTARYNGDANYSQKTSASINQQISQLPATVVLTATPMMLPAGKTSTLTVTVSTPDGPVTTGSVTFMQGDTPIATKAVTNGTVTLPVTFRLAGTYTFTAVYSSDGNTTNGESQPVTITVTESTVE